jgi:hypothetical protein
MSSSRVEILMFSAKPTASREALVANPTSKRSKPLWLIELDQVPHAIFDSLSAASNYGREVHEVDPHIAVTTTQLKSYLKEPANGEVW